MTVEIAQILTILLVTLILLVCGRPRMDLVALLVLGTLAISGLLTPEQAVAGFSNPAVITIWAMFILSQGLARTGIASLLGNRMLRMAGPHEMSMIVVIMLCAGLLSAFMNNIGVAALMLPVVLELARRTRIPASKLLLPLVFAITLGGLTTLVSTPTNLLVSNAMLDAGFAPFRLFDFTPVGVAALLGGTLFMALIGRWLLPRIKSQSGPLRRRSQRQLRRQYGLRAETFTLQIPKDSPLIGKTLSQSRIGSAVGLVVLSLTRGGRSETLPSRQTVLVAGDQLLVQGRLDRLQNFRRWSELVIEREAPVLQSLMSAQMQLAEVTIAEHSPLVSQLLSHGEFRRRYLANVLAIRRQDVVRRTRLTEMPLRAGDVLLVQGAPTHGDETLLNLLTNSPDFSAAAPVGAEALRETYRLQERIFVVRVPKDSQLAGETLARSRLGDAFDFRALGLFRHGELQLMPDPDEALRGGDLILVQGLVEDFDILRGLQALDVQPLPAPALGEYQPDRLALLEATLDPHSQLIGRPLRLLDLRERYGLEVVGVWRRGVAYRANLEQMALELGDALLLLGPQQRLQMFENDPDFLVLTPQAGPPANLRRAPLAGAIMLAVIAATVSGAAPIHIAAILGAAAMVITGCLNMDDAYRAIEWRAIFLIAGLLPLGTAMQQTGAGAYLASLMLEAVADLGLGPWGIIAGLYLMVVLGALVMPVIALVVLISPLALSISLDLGVAPHTAMMAIAMAAASFMSPVSHPANLLMMGPGGYRFSHYIRVGLPVALVVMLITFQVLPIFWPLTPLQ